jgi:hypothetical protein
MDMDRIEKDDALSVAIMVRRWRDAIEATIDLREYGNTGTCPLCYIAHQRLVETLMPPGSGPANPDSKPARPAYGLCQFCICIPYADAVIPSIWGRAAAPMVPCTYIVATFARAVGLSEDAANAAMKANPFFVRRVAEHLLKWFDETYTRRTE